MWDPLIDWPDQEWTCLSVHPSFHEVLYLHGDMMYKLSQDQDVVSFVTLTYDDCDGIKTLIIKPALVVSNQTTNLLSFRGEVSQENSISNLEVNEDFIRVVKTTGGDVKPMSFLSLMSKGDGTDVYNLYLSTDDHHWSSNIRVYLDGESRFCTTVPTPEACDGNMPVIIHTNRLEEQVFIVVREDTKKDQSISFIGRSGKIASASVQVLMLEKSRVVRRPEGKPNFNKLRFELGSTQAEAVRLQFYKKFKFS